MAVSLSNLDFVNGLFSVLVITVGAIIGLIIASKYIKFKNKAYLYWGLAYTGFYCAWWPSGISFLSVLITGQPLSKLMYIIIGNVFIPIFMLLWLLGLTEMIYEDKRKILLILYSAICGVVEIILIYIILADYTILAEFTGVFDVTYNRIWLIYLLFINFTITITGLIFARDSLKSDEREVRFKGKILIIAFLSYPICGIIDGGVELNEIGVIIIRSLLMFGAVMFYIGFFVPRFVRKLFKFE